MILIGLDPGLAATGMMGALLLLVTGRERLTKSAVDERTVQLKHEITERQMTERALREMRRVCRPGGLVAARDSDYAAMTWYPADPALDAWLAPYRAHWVGRIDALERHLDRTAASTTLASPRTKGTR